MEGCPESQLKNVFQDGICQVLLVERMSEG